MPRKNKPKRHNWRKSYDAKPITVGPLPVILCRESARGSMFRELQATREPMPTLHMDHTGEAVDASLDKPDMYKPMKPAWAWSSKAKRDRVVPARIKRAVAAWMAKRSK